MLYCRQSDKMECLTHGRRTKQQQQQPTHERTNERKNERNHRLQKLQVKYSM